MTDNLYLELKNEINKYMDCELYDQKNWTNRNEKFGNSAVLTLTAEGTLNHILNGYVKPHKNDLTYEKLSEIANKYNCYIEQGTHWSWHFIAND